MSTEDREDTRYIRELKKQIQKLKRENQQLRKSKRIVEAVLEGQEYEKEIFEVDKENHKKTDKKRDACPKCHSEAIIIFELRELPYYRCNECNSKGRFPDKN
ncbi:MAG: hypothetical protein QXL01_02875 [Thermoplasmatales archaeon]